MDNIEFKELFNQNIEPFLEIIKDRIVGRIVGYADTYDTLPLEDKNGVIVNIGDNAILTTKDGDHNPGIYEYNGINYELKIMKF